MADEERDEVRPLLEEERSPNRRRIGIKRQPSVPSFAGSSPNYDSDYVPDVEYGGPKHTCPSITRTHSVPGHIDEGLVNQITAESLGLKPYKRRFYLTAVFWWLCLLSGMFSITFSTLSHSLIHVFGYTKNEVALLVCWNQVGFLIASVPLSWIQDTKGLRWIMIILSSCLLICSCLRIIAMFYLDIGFWLLHVAQFFCGFVNPIGQVAPTAFSATWYPMNQRATCTSFTVSAITLGTAFGALLGPFFVHDGLIPHHHHHNHSIHLSDTHNITNSTVYVVIEEMKQLFYLQTAAVGLGFILVILYFPAKPPIPPSISAAAKKMDITKGIKMLLSCPSFHLLTIGGFATIGVYTGWVGMIGVNLGKLGYSQSDEGYVVFFLTTSGVIAGYVLGLIADKFSSHFKAIVVATGYLAIIPSAWFILQLAEYLPSSLATIYISDVLVGTLLVGVGPVVYELLLEVGYPAPEGLIATIPAILQSCVSVIFLLIVMIPDVGLDWMNWAFLATTIAAPILFSFVKVDYRRQDLDRGDSLSNDYTVNS